MNDTLYMINFPPSAEVTLPGAGGTCAELCGYHGTGVYQGQVYAYAVIPDFFVWRMHGWVVWSRAPLQSLTNIASHELVESVTDPEVGLAASPTSRPGAWHDATCGEIGDICEHLYGTIDPSGTTWTVTQLWSNAADDCITTKASIPAVCIAANSPPGCRLCACSDDNRAAPGVPGCGGATPWCETDATNVKHDFCVECTSSAECTTSPCSRSAVATDDTCVAAPVDAGVDSIDRRWRRSGSADVGADASADSGSMGIDSGSPVADSGSSNHDSGASAARTPRHLRTEASTRTPPQRRAPTTLRPTAALRRRRLRRRGAKLRRCRSSSRTA